MATEKSEMRTHIHVAREDRSRSLQLTRGEESTGSPAFSPDSRYIYFLSERSGEENIWRIAVDGGEAERVTDWDGSIGDFRPSPDGKWIAFRGRKKDVPREQAEKEKRDMRVVDQRPASQSLWLIPLDRGAEPTPPEPILEGERHVADFRWSPDSRRIAVEHWPRPEPDFWLQSDISEVDLSSREVRPLASEKVSEREPHYSHDGLRLAYVRSSGQANWAGEGRIAIMDLEDHAARIMPVTYDEFGRGSRILGFSADSQRIFFTETQGTKNVLMSMTMDGEASPAEHPRDGTLASYGRASALNVTGTHFGFAREHFTQPVEAYVLQFDNGEMTRVSDVHTDLPHAPFGHTEVIHWRSGDGMEVEGLLTYPVGFTAETRVPLALVIHGGPMGVFTETFIGARDLYPVASFAARGYAVLRPNPRGSSGYGLDFRVANFGDWGGGDYADIMSGVDKVIEMGVADPDRMAVMGWSYGGFMTSWVIGQTDRFQAACVGAAVTNLWSFTGTSDILDFLPAYFGGEPWEVFEAYRIHSPMAYVQNVTTPTLVLHGEDDRRVPVSQGYEFYNALKRRGVETTMVVYPRTPHGPREPKFMLDVAQRHLNWVEQHLAEP